MTSWIQKFFPSQIRTEAGNKKNVPEGLWDKCQGCNSVLYKAELERNLHVCPKCGHHMRIEARKRLEAFFDPQSTEKLAENITPIDILNFKDSKKYKDRLAQAQKNTGETDALIVLSGKVEGVPLVAAAFDFRFMGGSMGSVVGERFIQAVQYAITNECAMVCFAASGGARMQEALFSLMQMAKTSAALTKLSEKGLPFFSVLTDPTMGGVSASFAMLGDVHIAEPNALIGFAGPRVIEQTVRETLPQGFQRSEFLLQKGAIDMIVDRRDLRSKISSMIRIMTENRQVAALPEPTEAASAVASEGTVA